MVGCFGRFFAPSPSLPGSPTVPVKLSSPVYKRSHGFWYKRLAELSTEGILSMFTADIQVKVYDLNLPRKMIVGAGKNSLHVNLITADSKKLYIKIKGGKRRLWANRMMDLRFPQKARESYENMADYEAEKNHDLVFEANDLAVAMKSLEVVEEASVAQMEEASEKEEDPVEVDINVWNEGYVARLARMFDKSHAITGNVNKKNTI